MLFLQEGAGVDERAGAIGRFYQVLFPREDRLRKLLSLENGHSAMGALDGAVSEGGAFALFVRDVEPPVADGIVDFDLLISVLHRLTFQVDGMGLFGDTSPVQDRKGGRWNAGYC